MQVADLDLAFKGDRTYLHGTDMYTATVGVLSKTLPILLKGSCRLVIHKIARHQCRLLYTRRPAQTGRPANLIAEFTFIKDGAEVTAWLVETARVVENRIPYQETLVTDKCAVIDQKVTLTTQTGFTAIEELLLVRGMTPDIFYGGLKEMISVYQDQAVSKKKKKFRYPLKDFQNNISILFLKKRYMQGL